MIKYLSLVGVITFCLILGYTLSNTIIQTIRSLVPKEVILVALQPSDGFMVMVWGTLIGTLMLIILLGGIWLWIYYKDILYEQEKRFLTKMIPTSFLLFVTGVVFGVLLYLMIVLPYFIEINRAFALTNVWSLNIVLSSALVIGLGLGISFQLPLILRFVIKSGLVKAEKIRAQRGLIVLVILIVSAVVTPPDVVSQLMVAFPLMILFEASLLGLN